MAVLLTGNYTLNIKCTLHKNHVQIDVIWSNVCTINFFTMCSIMLYWLIGGIFKSGTRKKILLAASYGFPKHTDIWIMITAELSACSRGVYHQA